MCELRRGSSVKKGFSDLNVHSDCWVPPLPRIADSLDLGWYLRICLFDKFLGIAEAAGEGGAF